LSRLTSCMPCDWQNLTPPVQSKLFLPIRQVSR